MERFPSDLTGLTFHGYSSKLKAMQDTTIITPQHHTEGTREYLRKIEEAMPKLEQGDFDSAVPVAIDLIYYWEGVVEQAQAEIKLLKEAFGEAWNEGDMWGDDDDETELSSEAADAK